MLLLLLLMMMYIQQKNMYVHYLVQLHFYDSHSINYLCFIMYSNKTVTTYMSHITLPSTRVFFCKLAFLFSVGSTVCTKTISLIFAPISIIQRTSFFPFVGTFACEQKTKVKYNYGFKSLLMFKVLTVAVIPSKCTTHVNEIQRLQHMFYLQVAIQCLCKDLLSRNADNYFIEYLTQSPE